MTSCSSFCCLVLQELTSKHSQPMVPATNVNWNRNNAWSDMKALTSRDLPAEKNRGDNENWRSHECSSNVAKQGV